MNFKQLSKLWMVEQETVVFPGTVLKYDPWHTIY